ncbi:HAD family phosphatase [Maribacter sp.]|nr:HAD family phosphatase [Maribacter sp.]
MKIRGVIFDFNGTLFFDTHLHNQAWDVFLKEHSISLDEEEKNRKIHGKNNAEILSNLFSNDLSARTITKLSVEKENIYQTLCLKQKMKLAPGAADFIKFLILKKVPFTIATASDLYNLKFYFKHLALAKYFDISKVVYSDGFVKSKPSPDIFLKAMNVLKIHPNETLVFEDSTAGILAAKHSGANKVIIVKSTDRDYSQWKYETITSFAEVDRSIFEIN